MTTSLKEPDAPHSWSRGRGDEMPTRRRLHGDINTILNPMVRDGLITGFRTNLQDRGADDEIVVTVTAPKADEIDGTWDRIRQALDRLPVDVVIRVDLP